MQQQPQQQQQLHALGPAASQQEQAALQQPVLALLSSGLPPIVLGTFQGDMQRARIILEAANFLIPLDASSSLLPPGLTPSPPQQRAAHAMPAALHAEHAALWSNPAAAVAAAPEDEYSSADEAGGMRYRGGMALTALQQAANEGEVIAS